MIKILIGGSPCTFWSIAQSKNRETEAEGLGWELFKNYLVAKEKFKPDFFLYENNKSASQAIKDQIEHELGVKRMEINSALVSAQNRQRFYVFNWDVEQPEDRGILLKDILENGENLTDGDKSYCLTTRCSGAIPEDTIKRGRHTMVAEPLPLSEKEMDYMVRETKDGRNHFDFGHFHDATKDKSQCITASIAKGVPYNVLAEPVAVASRTRGEDDDKFKRFEAREDEKANCLTTVQTDSMVAEPVAGRVVGRRINEEGHRDDYNLDIECVQRFEVNDNPNKTNCLTTVQKDNMIAQPIPINASNDGTKSKTLLAGYYKFGMATLIKNPGFPGGTTAVAQPICHNIQQEVVVRKYTCDIEKLKELLRSHKTMTNKAVADALDKPVTEVEHWFRTDDCFSVPDPEIWFKLKELLGITTTEFDDFVTVFEVKDGVFEKSNRCYDVNGKMSTLMTGSNDKIIEPVRVGTMPSSAGEVKDSQGTRIYATDGKSVGIKANGGGWGAKTGLYAIPSEEKDVYTVKDGMIVIKGKEYPIKLADGQYKIRKLTVKECCRLQTVPDDFCRAVSDSQAYKGLGNGWTAEVIIHILNGALKDVPKDEEIVVLSMYDGIGTGRYCLDKMGFTNVKYYAYEIDKFAMQVAKSNYPDIIEMGDAFDLRKDEWGLEGRE